MKNGHRHKWKQLGIIDRDDGVLVVYACELCCHWSTIELDELAHVDVIEGDLPGDRFEEVITELRTIETRLTPPTVDEIGALSRVRKLLKDLDEQTARELDNNE